MKERSEVIAMFLDAEAQGRVALHAKTGNVTARLATPGEIVITVIDGVEETRNTAKEDSVVVRGVKGERYCMAKDKFLSRYAPEKDVGADWVRAKPSGTCLAFIHEGEDFSFKAPWGEEMIVRKGDAIAMADRKNPDDIYRIERGAFAASYAKVPEPAAKTAPTKRQDER